MEGDAPDKFPSSLELENRQMELQPGPQSGAMGDRVMAKVCTTSIRYTLAYNVHHCLCPPHLGSPTAQLALLDACLPLARAEMK